MNRTEIIQNAIALANKNGLSDVTIAALAKSFKVKSPSLYKHIENLQEIHDALGIICLERLINLIQANSFGLSGKAALKEFCYSSRKFAIDNPGLYQAMQLTHVKRSKPYMEKAEVLMSMISKLLSQFKVKTKDIIHVMRHLRCLLHGFIDLELQKGFGLSTDLDRSFEYAINGFIATLNKKPARSKYENND